MRATLQAPLTSGGSGSQAARTTIGSPDPAREIADAAGVHCRAWDRGGVAGRGAGAAAGGAGDTRGAANCVIVGRLVFLIFTFGGAAMNMKHAMIVGLTGCVLPFGIAVAAPGARLMPAEIQATFFNGKSFTAASASHT